MLQIYEQNSADKPFIKKNYKQSLMDLEEQGKVAARPSANDRRKGTFADRVLVQFPSFALEADEDFEVPHASAG